jgi:Tfp pilus assembly protein PilF
MLLTSRKPVDPQSYEAYLCGAFGGHTAASEQYLKQSIQIDPSWAPPYESLAMIYFNRNMYPTFAPRDTYPKAKEFAQKALTLDPSSAAAHNVLASIGGGHW